MRCCDRSDCRAPNHVGLLLEAAGRDERLWRRLEAAARAAAGEGIDVDEYRALLDTAVRSRSRGFVDYREARDWAHDVETALDALQDLLEAGHAAAVVQLAEHAHRRVTAAIQYVDDCHAIRQRTRQLDDDVMADYRRRQLYTAEARAAEAQGDPDEVARILEPHLHLPADHLQVARAMHGAGRLADAIGWCRRALADHADRPDHLLQPVRDLLAQLLAEDGDHDAVTALRREEFDQRPGVGTYRQLTAAAGVGAEGDAAVQRLAHAVAGAVPPPARGVEIGGDDLTPLATPLVAVLLERDEVADAWRAATTYGCDGSTWHQLARRRAATHPLEVVAIHHKQALHHAEQTKRPAYRAAVRALTHAERCCQAGDDPDRFAAIIDDVRQQHGRKWSFMAMLDERGW